MAEITKIIVFIATSRVYHAGTDGAVYIGIAGREFSIDSIDTSSNDFERGASRAYVLGEAEGEEEEALMSHEPSENDPRNPQLYTEDIDSFPIYLRFEPKGEFPNWCLDEVTVDVYAEAVEDLSYSALKSYNDPSGLWINPQLWLGQNMGKFLYLKKFERQR